MGSTQTSPAPSLSRLSPEHIRSSPSLFSTGASSYIGGPTEYSLQSVASSSSTPALPPTCIRSRGKDWWRNLPFFELYELLDAASDFPPITRKSLSELDTPRFINDELLRHNLNFEAFAQFWPNYNTEFGRQCRAAARWYWAALEIELVLFMRPSYDGLACEAKVLHRDGRLGRLPVLFETLKDILQILLRQDQAHAIEETLDIPLLLQQIKNDVCDLVKLAKWIATVLKTSCSPQRDDDVVRAAGQIKMAATQCDPSAMVDGIESLFSVLETMKLVRSSHHLTEPPVADALFRMLRITRLDACGMT